MEGIGPDLVVAGSARSGTSFLAAHLAAHPNVDPGRVKEPNFFSRNFDRGAQWYDGVFADRTAGMLRMDASASYTYPHFPEALDHLAATSPEAFVVYAVREPLERALSHYLYYRYYFRKEPARDFGEAMRTSSFYTDVSDYSRWLPRLRAAFGDDRLLVVPFEAITSSGSDVLSVICRALDIAPVDVPEQRVDAHRNNVVEFRAETVRRAVKVFRRNPTYLRLRSAVGPHRVRQLRSWFTREATLPTLAEALATCDARQLESLARLQERAWGSVAEHLREQDVRRGLDWAGRWRPPPRTAGLPTGRVGPAESPSPR